MYNEEFESLLEEAFMAGYEDADDEYASSLLEQAFSEGYDDAIEALQEEQMPFHRKAFIRGFLRSVPVDDREEVGKALVRKLGKNKYVKDKDKNLKEYLDKNKGISSRVKLAAMANNGIKSGLATMGDADKDVKNYYRGFIHGARKEIKKTNLPKTGVDEWFGTPNSDTRKYVAKELKGVIDKQRKLRDKRLKDLKEGPEKDKNAILKNLVLRAKDGSLGDNGKKIYNAINTMHKSAKEHNKKRDAEQAKWMKEVRERSKNDRERTDAEEERLSNQLKGEARKFGWDDKRPKWNQLTKDEQDKANEKYANKAKNLVLVTGVNDKRHKLLKYLPRKVRDAYVRYSSGITNT